MGTRTSAMALFLCLTFTNAGKAGTITFDDFDDNSLNLSLWGAFVMDYGSVNEVNQRIEVSIPAHSGFSSAGIGLTFLVGGDFDAQVDFAVLSSSGTPGLALSTGNPLDPSVGCGHMMDVGGGFGSYFARFCDGVWFVPSPETTGRLRMVRSGSTYSGYFWDGAAWQLIHSSPGQPAGHWWMLLSTWSVNGSVQVAFDNFYLEADSLTPMVPEPGSFTLAGIALGLIWAIGKRRQAARPSNPNPPHTLGAQNL